MSYGGKSREESALKAEFKALGLVFTRQRAAVYHCMQALGTPQTAAQIAAALEGSADSGSEKNPRSWLSTVYRCLELFVEKGLASPFKLPEGEAFAYYLNDKTHRHYAVCTQCHSMIDLRACPLHGIEEELQARAFTVSSHHIEVYGRCALCSKKPR